LRDEKISRDIHGLRAGHRRTRDFLTNQKPNGLNPSIFTSGHPLTHFKAILSHPGKFLGMSWTTPITSDWRLSFSNSRHYAGLIRDQRLRSSINTCRYPEKPIRTRGADPIHPFNRHSGLDVTLWFFSAFQIQWPRLDEFVSDILGLACRAHIAGVGITQAVAQRLSHTVPKLSGEFGFVRHQCC